MSYLSQIGAYLSAQAYQRKLIIWMFGQSNSPGRKSVSGLSEPWKSILTPAQPNVTLYDYEATNAVPPVLMYDTGPAQLVHRVTVAGVDFGSELSLGYELDAIVHGWFIGKYGIGGTDLYNQWNELGTFPAAGAGNLFNLNIARMFAAQVLFGGQIGCGVYTQGESDADDATMAANYGTRLQRMFDALWVHFPGLPIVYSRLSSGNRSVYKADVQAGQDFVAAHNANVFMVNPDALPLDTGLHYTPDGYRMLGQLYAPAVIYAMGLHKPPVADFSWSSGASRTLVFEDQCTDTNWLGGIVSWSWTFGDGGTSTSQNPSHTYSADGPYTVKLVTTDNTGVTASKTRTVTVALPTWPTDATSEKALAFTAAHWADINTKHNLTSAGAAAGVPLHSYDFGGTVSATILDKIGSLNLTVANSPTFGKVIPGWTQKAVGASGAATTQQAVNSAFPSISGHDALVLALLRFTGGAANREIMHYGNSGVNAMQSGGGTSFMRKRTGSTFQNGLVACTNTVIPVALLYNSTGQVDAVYTNREKLAITWASATGTALAFVFSLSTDVLASSDFLAVLGVFLDADARRTDDEIRDIWNALGYPVSGY